MRLDDIAGQEHALAVVRRAIHAGRVPHAYLFDGPPGIGKRSAARGLGLALVCPEAPGAGCGRCDVCRRVLDRNHPDVWVFDAAELPELAKASSERSAVKYAGRHVFPYALHPPHEAPARVLVLDNADELSVEVQNTLLKTLEEPRPGVHIVLVTATRDRLLPTILSRTQRVRFVPVRAAVLMALGEREGLPRDRAETAAALAGGSVARFLELARAEGDVGPWQEVTALRRAAAAPGMEPLFDTAVSLGDKASKEKLPQVLALLAGLYRDALASNFGSEELVLLRERAGDIRALAAAAANGAGRLRLRRALRAVVEAGGALEANVNAVAALERMLLELRPCERGVQA
jgi:DNA polymerase III subunit delta'